MKQNDDAILLDILNAARLAIEFTAGLDKTGFLEDLKVQSAVLHQLLVLGEAVKRLSENFRTQHSQVPWKNIAGMRDKLIHKYDDIDLEQVWKTVTADLPRLVALLEPFAPRRENET